MCNVECLVGHASSCEIIAQSGTEIVFFLLGVSSCILRALCVRIVHRVTQRFHGGTRRLYFFSQCIFVFPSCSSCEKYFTE